MSNLSTDSPTSTPKRFHSRWKETKHQPDSPFSTPSKTRNGLRQENGVLTPRTQKTTLSALPFAESPLKQPPWRYVAPTLTFKEIEPPRSGLSLTEEEAVDIVKKMANLIPLTPASQLFKAEREVSDEKEQRNTNGQSGDDEEDRIIDPFPLSIFDSLIKQNLRILKYINSVDHFYSLFVPFYDHRMNTEWAEPSHDLNIAVNQADYPGDEKYSFWDEVKRRKFYCSFGPPSSPYRYQSPLLRTPPYTPTKPEMKTDVINALSEHPFRTARSLSEFSASIASTPSSRSPASSAPNTPSKDREKEAHLQSDKEKERDRELLRIKLAQLLHTAKVSSVQTRHSAPAEHANSTEHEAETFLTLLQNDDTLLDLLQQLRRQTLKKERKKEPRREMGQLFKDFLVQFNHCLHDKLSFLSRRPSQNQNLNPKVSSTTPLKHHQHYKNRRPHVRKPKDPINFPLPEDPIYGTPKHRRRRPARTHAAPTPGGVDPGNDLQVQAPVPPPEVGKDSPIAKMEAENNPGSDSETPGGEVELSTFLVTSSLLDSPSKKKDEDIPPSPSSSRKGFMKSLRFSNPLAPETESKNDYSSRLSSIINPLDLKLSPSFLNRKPRRARSQSRASSRYLASGRSPKVGTSLDSPSSHRISTSRRYSSEGLQPDLMRPGSSSPYSFTLTPSSSKHSVDISSSPPSSPFSPIYHLQSSISSGLSYFTRRSLLPAFDSSSTSSSSSQPMGSNSESTMESSFGSLSYLLNETLDPLEEENTEVSEFLGSSSNIGVGLAANVDSGDTSSSTSSTSSSSSTSNSSSSSPGSISSSGSSGRRRSNSSTPSRHSSRSSESSESRSRRRGRRRRKKLQDPVPAPAEVQSDVLNLLEFLCTPEVLASQNQDPLEDLGSQDAHLSGRPSSHERMASRKKVSKEELLRLHSALGQLQNFAFSSSHQSLVHPLPQDPAMDQVQIDGRDISGDTQEEITDELVQDEEVYVTEEGHTLVRLNRVPTKKITGLRFQLHPPIPSFHAGLVGLLA